MEMFRLRLGIEPVAYTKEVRAASLALEPTPGQAAPPHRGVSFIAPPPA